MSLEPLSFVVILLAGFCAAIVDSRWEKYAPRDTDKGLKVLEHYHHSIVLAILGVLAFTVNPLISFGLWSAGVVFLIGEWRQIHYISNGKVLEGHPFAMGSNHFTASAIIGICLVGLLITITLLI